MSRQLSILGICSVAIYAAGASGAAADKKILQGCSNGSTLCIEAVTGQDIAAPDRPFEKSYAAVINAENLTLRSKIYGTGRDGAPLVDFYTFVRVQNHFEDGAIIAQCNNRGERGNFTTANVVIDYIGAKGASPVTFVPLGALFVHASNVDDKGKPVSGCTFKSAGHQTGPYLLYTDQSA